MIIWVLVLLSKTSPQLFVNTYDTKVKCEQRIKEMMPIYEMKCVETSLNK